MIHDNHIYDDLHLFIMLLGLRVSFSINLFVCGSAQTTIKFMYIVHLRYVLFVNLHIHLLVVVKVHPMQQCILKVFLLEVI